MTTKHLQLISFKLCPFVQRSVILLNEKNAEYELSYIELDNKPDSFLAMSPLGKVPVLRVGDTSIFESAVIAEYLDETQSPALHPADPLEKARHRAWIEYSSNLIMTQHRMMVADNPEAVQKEHQALMEGLQRLGEQCDAEGPFFAGKALTLVDTAVAPLFMRMDLIAKHSELGQYPNDRVQSWAEALAAKSSVQYSVVDEFEALFFKRFEKLGGYLFLTME